jgi:TonB family protein
VDYGLGLMKLGALEERRNQRDSAKDFYTRAAAAIGEKPEAATAHVHLGMIALTQKEFDTAKTEFQHAGTLDPTGAGQAQMWLGVVAEREKKQDEAEVHFRTSIDMQDPNSHDVGTSMRLLSALLKAEGRDQESSDMMERAKTAQRNSIGNGAKSAAIAGAYKVGGSILAPKVLFKVDPQYTEEARAAKYQGTVLLSVVIGADGLAHDAQVIQALGLGLDQNAIDAVSQWKFQPGTKDGQPVPVMATIEVNFKLL